ncbi:hypothetical protein ACFV6B_13360 [Streptomyces microflavus]|uniref:hypothetical protein n=1 Tax=Streptomyces microflavus TaxID=1919 RepID=UPI00364FEC2F
MGPVWAVGRSPCRFLLVVVAHGMTMQQAGPVPVEQIVGETWAVDLVVAYVGLWHNFRDVEPILGVRGRQPW